MYKVIIGLEVHCELKTNSKCFSSSKNLFSDKPNINVSEIDLGLPGIMPSVNEEASKKAIKTAIALNCEIPDEIIFDRKNYFYPDLPKGYQITQVTKPMGKKGYLDYYLNDEKKRVHIHQLHLEEDTASMEHFSQYSLIDYNRSGIPLIEIVTEPCIYSSDEAVEFLENLRDLFLYCNISEVDTKKGQMRCDVNISLKKEEDEKLGTKVEIKNLNSFSSVKESIEYEIIRQSKMLEKDEKIIQETRRYCDIDKKTYSMREKVDSVDYKYFIEPNIPPIEITEEFLSEIKNNIPELKISRYEKYTKEYLLSEYDSKILVKTIDISNYYEETIKYGVEKSEAARWVITDILGNINKVNKEISDFVVTPKILSKLIKLVKEEQISLRQAQKTLYISALENKDPIEILKETNAQQINDTMLLKKYIVEALDENQKVIDEYKSGKDYAANFFVGKVMKKTQGQANPKITLELVKEELGKR